MSRENARYSYTAGSRPEGVVIYDADSKLHSHHDTDPARGQHSAFDLVRLHRFGHLDKDAGELPVTDLPSYEAMCEFARSLPELQAQRADSELEPVNDDSWLDTPAPASRFTPRPPSEFTSGPPEEWLIRGVLPQAGLVVIYGESGSGKTFLTLDMVAALTRGIEWNGRRTKKCKVAYIAAEGAGGFKKRLRAYARKHAVDIDTLPWVIPDSPYFLNREHPDAIIAGMKATGQTDIVVVDTLSAVIPGGNENSGEVLGAVIGYCKHIHRQTGALVILIHHSGKDAARGARGWSGLRAAVDAEIEVTRKGDYRTWATAKMRDGSDNVGGTFKLQVVPLGEDAHGDPISSCVVEHTLDEIKKPKGKVQGDWQLKAEHIVRQRARVEHGELIEAIKKSMPRGDSKRDDRRKLAKRAIEELIGKKVLRVDSPNAGDKPDEQYLALTLETSKEF